MTIRKEWNIPSGGMPQRVYYMIKTWYTNYEAGIPLNPKKIPHPKFGDDQPITLTTRYQHEISFRYNELKWLASVLELENDKTTQAQIFKSALNRHKELIDAGRIAGTLPHQQSFDLTKDEVGYIYELLSCLLLTRKLTPSEKQLNIESKKKEIEDGKW